MTTDQYPLSLEEKEERRRVEFMKSCPAGVIGIVCGEQARWSVFTLAMSWLGRPMGSMVVSEPGLDITKQCNSLIEAVRRSGTDWLWIIGDDHYFDPDIIFRLLKHDVDVVVPNVLQRSAPFNPVIYDHENEDHHHMPKFDLPEKGCHEVYAAGSAGMLIRRHVIDALPAEPFRRWGHLQNEDLEFCRLVREAGFKIWCDVETWMGHVGTMHVRPRWSEQDQCWEAGITIGPDQSTYEMPIKRIGPTSLASA